ncbi:MAG TPA: MFS transporter [Streptosporangiaceae bacterium]|nr:MFS transporter [Streptosporangiaceae bacterium]
MSATTAEPVTGRSGASWLWRRQLDSYPDTAPRITYLALTVLATITLYYELYVVGSVSTLVLANLHMTFTFYVLTIAFGNLIGAFGSLFAGITDRYGRANLVVFGLLFTGVFVAFILPAATNKWAFTIEGFVVGLVEGICLVATPALIRDFSPQLGRGTAMGFWTSGPVVGSLIVAVVGSATVPTLVTDNRFWTHEYHICGIAGLVVFVIALIGLRELSPRLRDQLMVSMRDRALIEARAKGLDVESMLHHPFRQLLKADVVVSSLAISIFLLIYYTAVGFLVIYMTTVFRFTIKDANGLGNWEWGFNVIAVVLIGILSDRLRVRKPFMVVGGVASVVMTVVFLEQFGRHPSYYTMAIILAAGSFCLGVAYVPWMASFTETVEARNPALIATGLAIWGWIIRIVVFVSLLIIPVVINAVTPLVNYGAQVQAYATKYPSLVWAGSHPAVVAVATKYQSELTFAQTHPAVVAAAQKVPAPIIATAQTIPPNVTTAASSIPPSVLATAQRLAPELAVISAHQALFLKLATYKNPATIPPALLNQAVAAAGGGTTYAQTLKGLYLLSQISKNQAAIASVVPYAAALQTIAPYAAQLKTIAPYAADLTLMAPFAPQLTALSKVPPSAIATVQPFAAELGALAKVPSSVTAFMKAHASAVQTASANAPGQWKTWWWVCVGGMVFFLLTIPLMRGRWRPRDAKRDEQEHEAMVTAELAKLNA